MRANPSGCEKESLLAFMFLRFLFLVRPGILSQDAAALENVKRFKGSPAPRGKNKT
jgi:hypothetical protein